MVEKEVKKIIDPDVMSILSSVEARNRHTWDDRLLELNGLMRPPTDMQLRAAIKITRDDETRAFDAYSKELGDSEKFGEIVTDANRGELWEKLGFNFNAAYHYSIAAEIAMADGASRWARKLINKASELYSKWKTLGKEDRLMLDAKIEEEKKIILDS